MEVQLKVKEMSFDRNIIKTNWSKINETPMKKAGLKVRNRAITSIRKDKRKRLTKTGKRGSFGRPSPPGKPPFSRFPGDPLRRIYSVPDNDTVIIGPIGFGDSKPVPAIHEKGLTKTIRRRKGRRKFDYSQERVEFETVSVQYPKRAFMVPAVEKVRSTLPLLWRNSLDG